MNTTDATISVDGSSTDAIYEWWHSSNLLYEGMGIGVVLSIVTVLILRCLTITMSGANRRQKLNPIPPPLSPRPVPTVTEVGMDTKWIKLVQSIIDLGDYINDMSETVDDDQKGLLKFFYGRLDDILASNGVTPIRGDTSFSILRHYAESFRDVEEGNRIADTIVQGWAVGDTVLRRAKVRVAE